ncbi:Diaminopimelate epimerase-like protein [Aspergillus steynii IBT 23096]|uniref:trans-L-3-hydroxyproline dehydratase n=1 Tax=Aspergillus steynii IBT 23096 TaxID=1392250 RepID=A0A2I2GRG3_9EURO|nr:Diaminopimelate epimerase-like protein [Aspergillus steynii IBT 23096]PLB55476.1 Diaminopimelate epimerase-like protein [Aspergillus steynii IBT 23096]
MYGGFIVSPNDSGALFGVLFWHKDGFSTACGHGTIALGYWAVAHRMLPVPDNEEVDVIIDVPSGRVKSRITMQGGDPIHAEFINVLSYQIAKDLSAALPSRGAVVTADLVFAGAVYATIDADQLGVEVDPCNYAQFIQLGREVKHSLGQRAHYGTHDLYCVIFYREEDVGKDEAGIVRQRNVTIFADGQIDRSPCGSGTCARLAVLLSRGRVGAGKNKLVHQSIIGTSFEADVVSEEPSPVEGFKACIPRVRGRANIVGQMRFWIDPSEAMFPGFLLR